MAIEKEWAKVCMGKDINIHITYPVTTNGIETSLEGRDFMVILKDSSGRVYHPTLVIDGNKISFWFYGKDHKHLGVHSIRLWENFGKVGQCPLDFTRAFELVATTDDEVCLSECDIIPDAIAKGFHNIVMRIEVQGVSNTEPVIKGTALVFPNDYAEVGNGTLIIR